MTGPEPEAAPESVADEPAPPALDELPGGARAAAEAVLMVTDSPVGEMELASALVVPRDHVRTLLVDLACEYAEAERGFELREVAGGWRIFSRPDVVAVVHRFVLDGQTARLSQAALETLAVVAYRQPISRARISAVRGVAVDSVVRTLLTRGLLEEAGLDDATGATLYGTTPYFLERMGLTSVADLPPLAPYLPGDDVLDELAAEQR